MHVLLRQDRYGGLRPEGLARRRLDENQRGDTFLGNLQGDLKGVPLAHRRQAINGRARPRYHRLVVRRILRLCFAALLVEGRLNARLTIEENAGRHRGSER